MDLFLTSSSTVQCVNIIIISDLTVEMNETFFVTLNSISSTVILGNTVSTVTITDTDSMLITTSSLYLDIFVLILAAAVSVPAVLSVAEDEGTVQVCATLFLDTEIGITVTLATSDGTGVHLISSNCV